MRHCLIWQRLHQILAPGHSLWDVGERPSCKNTTMTRKLEQGASPDKESVVQRSVSIVLKGPHFHRRCNHVLPINNGDFHRYVNSKRVVFSFVVSVGIQFLAPRYPRSLSYFVKSHHPKSPRKVFVANLVRHAEQGVGSLEMELRCRIAACTALEIFGALLLGFCWDQSLISTGNYIHIRIDKQINK